MESSVMGVGGRDTSGRFSSHSKPRPTQHDQRVRWPVLDARPL